MAVHASGSRGFGRIGRQSPEGASSSGRPDVEVVAVNDLVDAEMNALLFKHDSTYGAYPGDRRPRRRRRSIIDGREIKVLRPNATRRRCRGATSASTSSSRATGHLHRRRRRPGRTSTRGAKKVIISAPAKGEDITIVLGVNEDTLRPGDPPHHQQRQLHDELPRAGGEGRPRPARRSSAA